MRKAGWLLAAGAAILVTSSARAEQPKLDTTADLIAYCDNVGPVGEVRDGQNFCDGFIAGSGLFYLELVKAKKIKRMACADPIPKTGCQARPGVVAGLPCSVAMRVCVLRPLPRRADRSSPDGCSDRSRRPSLK